MGRPTYAAGHATRIQVFGKDRKIIVEILLTASNAEQPFWPHVLPAFEHRIEYGTVDVDGNFTPCVEG